MDHLEISAFVAFKKCKKDTLLITLNDGTTATLDSEIHPHVKFYILNDNSLLTYNYNIVYGSKFKYFRYIDGEYVNSKQDLDYDFKSVIYFENYLVFTGYIRNGNRVKGGLLLYDHSLNKLDELITHRPWVSVGIVNNDKYYFMQHLDNPDYASAYELSIIDDKIKITECRLEDDICFNSLRAGKYSFTKPQSYDKDFLRSFYYGLLISDRHLLFEGYLYYKDEFNNITKYKKLVYSDREQYVIAVENEEYTDVMFYILATNECYRTERLEGIVLNMTIIKNNLLGTLRFSD